MNQPRVRSVTQSCLTPCDPLDCSLARLLCPWDFLTQILEWVAISFSNTVCFSESYSLFVYCKGGYLVFCPVLKKSKKKISRLKKKKTFIATFRLVFNPTGHHSLAKTDM